MADKVQKIREEVVRIINNINLFTPDEDGKNSSYEAGKLDVASKILQVIDSLQEEPVSEELEKACEQLAENARKHKAETSSPFFSQTDYKQGVIDGAKWQAEQFEKNRLAACDKQTEEEAEIEFNFVMSIIENEHRQPTFDDAIKYGMRLQLNKSRKKYEKNRD